MSNRTCDILDCDKPAKKRGWCMMHYTRWIRNGDPITAKRFADPRESLRARSVRDGDCIVYTGHRTTKGYGAISVNYDTIPAHRFAWEVEKGPIPDGMQIDHICHNKACVNVDHLRVTTAQQNKSNHNGANRNNKSTGIRNVQRVKGGRFAVSIRREGKLHYFGRYDTISEAAEVADRERARLFGEYAGRGGAHGGSPAVREGVAVPLTPFAVD